MKATATLRSFVCVAAVLLAISVGWAQKPELVVQTGHSSSVSSVAFSPDGKTLASGSNDNTIKLWDVASGRELRTFAGHSRGVGSVAFSPDGKMLASGSDDKTVRLWDVARGRELRTLTGHSKSISSVAFSPDGTMLASGSSFDSGNRAPDPIRLWEVSTGRELRSLKHSDGVQGINAIAFGADGSTLASGGDDGTIKLWQTQTGRELRTLRGHVAAVSSLAFSEDKKTLASGGDDKQTKLWDLSTGTELRTLTGHSEGVGTVAFTPDGKTLASGSGNILNGHSMIKIWDVVTGREVHTLIGQSGRVTSIAFSPDGKTLAGGTGNISGSSVINLLDVATWQEVRVLGGNSRWVNSVAFSADGKTLAGTLYDKAITLWDMTTGRELHTLSGHSSWVRSAAFSPDGSMLASGGGDKTVRLWDVATGKEVNTLTGHTGPVNSVAFSSDGKTLASGSYDNTVKLWDVVTRKEIKTLAGHSADGSVAFSPDGKLLANGSDDSIKVWEVASGRELRKLAGHTAPVTSIVFSLDGRMLASGSNDHTVKLWDLGTGRELRTLAGHSNFVSSVAFADDGKTLASSSWDKTTKLWDVTTGRNLQTLSGHSDVVSSVAFTGAFLVTGSADATMKLWRQDNGIPLATLIPLGKGDWVVVSADNRFDTNKDLDSIEGLHWILPDAPFTPLPLEIFMRDYYEPQLLARLMKCNEEKNCEREFRTVRDISTLNRVQPPVEIKNVSAPDAGGYVNVTVEVGRGDGKFLQGNEEITRTSEVYDLRLFRDGQLVSYWPRDGAEKLLQQTTITLKSGKQLSSDQQLLKEEQDWQLATRVPLDAGFRKTLNARVRLPKGKDLSQIEFTAYAFNENRIKSQTAKWNWPAPLTGKWTPAQVLKRRAYIITVGVNASENPGWTLQYAVNDAFKMRDTLAGKLQQLKQADGLGDSYEVVALPLVSDYAEDGTTLKINDATKRKIRAVIDLLAGRKVDHKLITELKSTVPQIGQLRTAQPDDLVLISFSSHGYTDGSGNFFILPYDVGPSAKITADLLLRSISSEEMSLWLRDVDAGDMVMIIDACHAAAVTGRDFKPGPMASRGLGQLAYDKGMSILTATQANNFALESGALGQGLLSYALIEDGLKGGRADFKPVPDGQITMREWLEYGVAEVPVLYEKIRNGKLKAVGDGARAVMVGQAGASDSYQQRPALFDFGRKRADMLISRTRGL